MKTLNVAENVKAEGHTADLSSMASRWRLPLGRLCWLIGFGLTMAVGGLALTLRPAAEAEAPGEEAAIAQVTARLLEQEPEAVGAMTHRLRLLNQ